VHDCSPARISVAWLLDKPVVASMIIGAKRLDQLQDNLAAMELKLTEDEIKLLDEVSNLCPSIRAGCQLFRVLAVPKRLTILYATTSRSPAKTNSARMMKTHDRILLVTGPGENGYD
jgi:Aldo/keto reductase family